MAVKTVVGLAEGCGETGAEGTAPCLPRSLPRSLWILCVWWDSVSDVHDEKRLRALMLR